DAVIRHCDYTGDSLELAQMIPHIQASNIVFCGVSFMGESAQLLTKKEQKVYLPDPHAHCMMALMASGCHVRSVLNALQKEHKNILPLAYVNTSVGLKAVVGAFGGSVCTSANAQTMLAWALEASDCVLFLPDKHLAVNTAQKLGLTEHDWEILRLSGDGLATPLSSLRKKKLLIWPGLCPLHGMITRDHITKARSTVQNCRILVHPECPPSIVAQSDGAGSTSYIIRETQKAFEASSSTPLVIGTEANLVARLAKRFGHKFPISPLFQAYCPDMNAVTEEKLLNLLQRLQKGQAEALELLPEECEPAKAALERMLRIVAKK
ncbi:MAG: quinolinate synthase NadA, partial [Desulfovibrio sp.]|nr:quinolinate synthase NadA [Desulfovibrio sp.]